MQIRDLKLENNLILAPMAGVGDIAFRILCRKYGAGLVCSEFLSAESISRFNKNAIEKTNADKRERPVSIQIFGNKIETISRAAKFLEDKVDIIDFNMGCPADKITRIACGAALLKNPEKIAEIVKTLKKSVSIPITIKIRLGIDEKSINAVKIAKIAEQNGADMIAVHGRTMKQGYSGNANWDLIKEVKENVSIPVAANGDIIDGESALKCLKKTKCDFLMIGRAAMKNPFVFTEINHYLKTEEKLKQTEKQRFEIINEYLKLAEEFKISFTRSITHINSLTRGLYDSTSFREELNKRKSFVEINELLQSYCAC